MVKLLIVAGVLTILLLGKSLSLPLLENVKLIEGNDLGDGAEIEDQTEIDDAEEIDLSNLDRSFFGKPDNGTTGDAVAQYNPDAQKVNPEELGSYLEGDMLMPNGPGRNGMISKSLRWKNAIVPYEIQGRFNAQELKKIEQGMKEYQAKTCIRFKPRHQETDYISIVNDNSGCWSSVGRIGGKQELNLQSPGCTFKVGTFMHEMMHALGFLHEQNRHERDSYITVQWDNIKSGVTHNFNKASATSTHAFGVPYDYGSIMHYSAYAFSVNGQPTILAKVNFINYFKFQIIVFANVFECFVLFVWKSCYIELFNWCS